MAEKTRIAFCPRKPLDRFRAVCVCRQSHESAFAVFQSIAPLTGLKCSTHTETIYRREEHVVITFFFWHFNMFLVLFLFTPKQRKKMFAFGLRATFLRFILSHPHGFHSPGKCLRIERSWIKPKARTITACWVTNFLVGSE